jgi:acetyl-CoA acetyltransferase
VSKDDGVRAGTTADGLGKIRSAFPQWAPGFTTGGNASQITDGAAAVMLMTRAEAERLQCPILGKWVTTSVTGMWRATYREKGSQGGTCRTGTACDGHWSFGRHSHGSEECGNH